ncbi:TatD family hydrolase [Quadrisphaera sp. DSM 44207]|uniref:TatD family hydrolase n=1 Tax=Quadrisphaera sp. DSM 44207 TaxID=1881057 RepID=UPI0015A297E4|nr:TatD family hydrolase [Quadrisphaera sp. DSM 44207]
MSAVELPEGYPPAPAPLARPVVDDHTHLDGLDDATVEALLAAAAAAGVPRAVQIGCDLPAARWTVRAAERWPQLVGGVAIHPNEAPLLAARGQLDAALAEVEALAAHPRVRVVGETGLDAFRTDLSDPGAAAAQLRSFRAHVAMARRTGRVLQIHDRDAHEQVLAVLEEEGAPQRTVFHCFSGDAAMARYCAERGWYLSFAGTLTFRSAGGLREALAAVPLEQVLVETDAPYLTPVPHRGRRNASHLMPHTVRCVAEVTRRAEEEVCEILAATADSLYGPW